MSELQRHVYEKDKIVIGGGLSALLYALSHELPVIYAESRLPFRFDEMEHENLKLLGLSDELPQKQSEMWSRIHFFLGLSGLLPMGTNVNNLRVTEKNFSKLPNQDPKKWNIKYFFASS